MFRNVILVFAILACACSARVQYSPAVQSAIAGAVNINTASADDIEKLPHVGRKTAERLVVDLRDKIAALSSPAMEEEFAAQAAAAGVAPTPDAMRDDAMSALSNLGYQKAAAEKAVKNAIDEGGELSVEVVLRRSLRSLAKA